MRSSPATRNTPVKSTVRCPPRPTRTAKVHRATIPNTGEAVGSWLSQKLPVGMQNGAATLDKSMAVSLKTKHTHTIQSGIRTPGHLSQRNENVRSHRTCTWKFTAALFVTAQTWKRPTCPSTGQCVTKTWPVHTTRRPKGTNTDLCNNLGGSQRHSAEKSHSQRLQTV